MSFLASLFSSRAVRRMSAGHGTRGGRQPGALPALVLALAGAGLVSVHPAVLAQAAAQPGQSAPGARSVSVPAGPLGQVLTAFARQAGVLISFDTGLVSGLSASGLQGSYSAGDGFRAILQGTGLEAYPGTGGWHLRRALSTAGDTVSLAPVVVQGQGETGTGQTYGVVSTVASTGTKTDTPLLETPQSISVITQTQIAQQGANTLNQVLRYTPGVAVETRGATATRLDQFTIRGFSATSYLDGLRVFGGRDALPQVDAYRLERVDVLKGPSSVMYGQGGPGGVVNQVSKRPVAGQVNEVGVEFGTNSLLRGMADVGGSLNDDGTLLYRVVGAGYKANGQLHDTKERRYYVSPSFLWQPTADTRLTVLTHFQRDPDMGAYGALPAMGTVHALPDGSRFSRSFYDGDKGFERSDRKHYSLGYEFEHRFNDTFKATQKLRYVHADAEYRSIYNSGWADPGTYRYLKRGLTGTDVKFDALTLDNNLLANFSTGPFDHTALLGFDYQRVKTDTLSASQTGDFLNLDTWNPNYDMGFTMPAFTSDQTQTQYQAGLYFQDQIKLGRLSVLLGGRYDWARTNTNATNLNTGVRTHTPQRAQAFTGRAGLLYLFDNGVAPYFSYSQSFEPQNGTGWDGAPFDPVEGEQYELGVKYEPAGSRTLLTAALYDIRRKNLTTTDPDPTHICSGGRCSIQAGEVRTRGLELEAKTEPVEGLSVIASYSWMQNAYTKDNPNAAGVSLKGTQPAGVPKHQASAWVHYEMQSGPLAGLGMGAGVRYLGETWGDANNTFKVSSATLFDLGLDYDLGRYQPALKGWQVSLNVANVFDKRYVASCLSEAWCWYGYDRTVKAAVRYRW
ncbi:TonB-dependent siderophore receptor [Bordetella muralis]